MSQPDQMDERTLRDRLRGFGLSEKEVDMYLAVLDAGEATTSTIAENSGVSQRYVYNVAEQLKERGLVEVYDHAVPKTIQATPPDEAVDTLVGQLREVTPALRDRYTASETETATFKVIKSRQTVLKHVRELLATATEEAFLALPVSAVERVESALIEAIDRGVVVMVLATGPGDLTVDVEAATTVVRHWEQPTPFVVTADGASGLIGERSLFTGRHANGEQAVSLTQSQIIGSLFGSFFGSFWPMGEEVYVTEACQLPRQFSMMRPVVVHATLHHRAGTPVRVVADVQATTNGTTKTIEGMLTGTRQGLLEPTTNSFPVENSLVVETDEGEVSLGGEGAFVEDYRAVATTLEPVE